MEKIGSRLREERERLSLTQEVFGVTRKTQSLYEKGERLPDAAYLASLALNGLDVLYILTGKRSAMALNEEQQQLLTAYQAATPDVRKAALAALQSGSMPIGTQMIFEQGIGNFTQGNTHIATQIVGGKKAKK